MIAKMKRFTGGVLSKIDFPGVMSRHTVPFAVCFTFTLADFITAVLFDLMRYDFLLTYRKSIILL